MGDLLKIFGEATDYILQCRCGSFDFNLRVDNVGTQYTMILGSTCADCGERVDFEVAEEDKK